MRFLRSTVPAALLAIGSIACPFVEPRVETEVTPSPPFVGDTADTFNQHNGVMATQSLSVCSGAGVLNNLSGGGAIKVEFSSNFNGDQVWPISDMMAGQLGVGQWLFDEPLTGFGAWWENNGGADDATVQFFDAEGVLLDTVIASVPADAQAWTWNGWTSESPFTRIEVTGNGVLNGFLWYEDVQITFAQAACPTDIDGDGHTGVADLMILLSAWGSGDASADVDGSGLVDFQDLKQVLQAWGACA